MIRFITIASAILTVLIAQTAQAQDAEAGREVFRKCKSCHMAGDGAKNRIGPVLTGVVGRQAGTYAGYKYGASMFAAGQAGLIWDEELLFDYLADPTAFLRRYLDDDAARVKMAFRLKDKQARRDVIAYLSTFSPATRATNDAPPESTTPAKTAANALCVRNLGTHEHFFAVEAEGAERRTAFLSPGEVLCTEATPRHTGVVSVYEGTNGFEGCSRLVPVGTTEDMLKYVDFDRCFWSSNS